MRPGSVPESWASNWGDNLLWNTRTLVIGATRNWARGVLLWNVALDERHGPHLGGCAHCRGVITIDSATGAVTRNEEFYALAHASRFVHPGAVRVASASTSSIDHVAFKHPTDGHIVVIAANSAATNVMLVVTGAPVPARIVMPARSVVTIQFAGTPPPTTRPEPR